MTASENCVADDHDSFPPRNHGVIADDSCSQVFDAGAGKYPGPGGYTQVAFTTVGKGQFKPGKGANPAIGSVGQLEHVEEVKVETLCVGEDVVRKAVGALKR